MVTMPGETIKQLELQLERSFSNSGFGGVVFCHRTCEQTLTPVNDGRVQRRGHIGRPTAWLNNPVQKGRSCLPPRDRD